MTDLNEIINNTSTQIKSFNLFQYVENIVSAAIILVVGLFLIKKFTPFYKSFLSRTVKDKTVEKFLVSLTTYILKAFVVIITITQLGVETSSLVAVLGAISFAIGLAFQGILSNFAGGVLILTQRPFEVEDYIEFADIKGTVNSITILNTTLYTVDNKVITIPNGKISNESITNYTRLNTRRVDLVVNASYREPSEKIIAVIEKAVSKNSMILPTPECQVLLTGLQDSSVAYTIRAWVKTEDYWTVYFDLMEKVKIEFDKEGIEIPYNKLDVNIIK